MCLCISTVGSRPIDLKYTFLDHKSHRDHTIIFLKEITNSVVILALNSRKSGQIANKGFMIYCGRYTVGPS